MTTSKSTLLALFSFFFLDNSFPLCRYNYDKKMSELYSADDDHPLKATEFSFSNLSVYDRDQINTELNSVAVDWKPFRNTATCSCGTPFDHFSGKVGFFLIEISVTKNIYEM